MIHVVFNEQDAAVIEKAIALDPTLEGRILVVRDDYAVGPLDGIYTPEGAAERKGWWKEVLSGSDLENAVEEGKVNDEAVVLDIRESLVNEPDEFVWIWAAQNKHDVCGYYWLISQLAEYQGRIFILYLNNLPFISEKGTIFYPDWLSQIPPKEFIKAKKLARPVTISEFEVDADEWNRICSTGSLVRLLEGGKKITHREVDFYDAELAKFITAEAQKANKVIHVFLSKSKETTGDHFLLWRLKQMVQNDAYEVQGEVKGFKDFEVKKKSAVPAED